MSEKLFDPTIPRPTPRQMQPVLVPVELHARLKALAEERGIKLGTLATKAIEFALDNVKAPGK